MDLQEYLFTALRATLIYFFLLLIIRLSGKRSVGQGTAFDLLVALMLGEVVDEIVFADVSIPQGLLVVVIIAGWHLINSYGSYRSKAIDELTVGKPTLLIEHGEIKRENLAKERMNENELISQMRLQSIDDIKEVSMAMLEPNGKVSFIKEDWAAPVQKGDLPKNK